MVDGRTMFANLSEGARDGNSRLFSPGSWSDELDLEALARFTP